MTDRKVTREKLPSDYSPFATRKTVRITELTRVISKISNEYLQGIVKLTVSGESTAYVTVSPYYIAHTLKLAAKYAGIGGLNVDISITDRLTISFHFPNNTPCANERSNIYSFALKTGLHVTDEGDRINLKCRFVQTRVMSLYAKSKNSTLEAFREVFEEEP